MKLVAPIGEAKPQRRILIEVPELVSLFDAISLFLQHEKDVDNCINVSFEEVEATLSVVLVELFDTIIERFSLPNAIKTTFNEKCQVAGIDWESVDDLMRGLARDKDDLLNMLAILMGVSLKTAIKTIVDDLLRENDLMNFKGLKIKTRRHVVVLC